jgi:uncharacterized protein (DUF1778 family)
LNLFVICTNIHFLFILHPRHSMISTTPPSPNRASRSARLGLRATPRQEAILRRAADAAHKSLTDFILDSACHAAEQTLLDQRLFMVSGSQYIALMNALDQPPNDNPGLRDLFARKAPWEAA